MGTLLVFFARTASLDETGIVPRFLSMVIYFYNLATDRVGGIFASFLKLCLWLLSLIYGLVIRVLSGIRGRAPAGLGCKVVSVGNITWGGTGKTPLVELIARFLLSQGRKPVIVTRGYKRSGDHPASCMGADPSRMGDEPYMLSRKLQTVPVIVASDRIKAGVQAQADHGADTVILDDGFQQWGVGKDLDIVTIDAANPFGNGCMIPRGILREPLSSLARADIFVLTNIDAAVDTAALKARLARLNPSALIVAGRHKPSGLYELYDQSKRQEPDALRGKRAALVCAIGNPDSFKRVVEALQVRVERAFVFPDHHPYAQSDMDMIARSIRSQGVDIIITTEKDAGKLACLQRTASDISICVLQVTLELVEHEELFYSRLRGLYSA